MAEPWAKVHDIFILHGNVIHITLYICCIGKYITCVLPLSSISAETLITSLTPGISWQLYF